MKKSLTSKNHNVIYAAILASIAICVLLYNSIRVERIGFLGIADSKELQINFEYPVEIRRVHVIPGQTVAKGDLLLELDQSELNAKLRDIDFRINRLESEMTLRRQIGRMIPKNNKAKEQFFDTMQSELNDLVKEKDYLIAKKKNLYVFSPASGVIGQVNYKIGEKANGFATILTLVNNSPTFVTGFINESLDVSLIENQVVKVRSASRADITTTGIVKSIGRRTVEMPQRLLKYQNVIAYGREVTLELSENNHFLIGEKVIIDPSKPLLSFVALANASKNAKTTQFENSAQFSLKKILIPQSVSERTKFEPSGAIWLADLNKYAVISDDTDENHMPYIFLVNRDGSIDNEVLKVKNLDKIMDIESIAQDDKHLYLLSSQSRNSSGDVKMMRNLLVQAKRTGLEVTLTSSFELRPVLLEAFRKSSNTDLNFIAATIDNNSSKADDLDIEGMTIVGEDLILALKAPSSKKSESYIIRLSNKEYIFKNKYIYPQQVSIEAKINFTGKAETAENVKMSLSDITYHQGSYYLATTCKKANCSALWKASKLDDTQIKLLKTFPVNQLEGLAIGPEKEIFGVFDEGKNESYYFINEAL